MKTKDIKPHIGIFGRRNNGKSSLINTLCGHDIAIVSDIPGTTTDPVKKSVEIFGIGPAIIVDTAGIDDAGELGQKRIKKSYLAIRTIDLAILLIAGNKFDKYEKELIAEFDKYDVPFLIVHNKSDIQALNDKTLAVLGKITESITEISIIDNKGIELLVEMLKKLMPETVYVKPSLFGGIVNPKDIVLLVTPIDSEAPEGRMILPQAMAIRDSLDKHAICTLVRETELEDFMKLGIRPNLVVTDSQAFEYVSSVVPEDILLTSFSIIFSRLKGDFEAYIKGTEYIAKLKDGDKALILESCTHHVSCEDIGRFKLPEWIRKYTGKKLKFDIVAGLAEIKGNPEDYAIVIQCGGCVVTRKQVLSRLRTFTDKDIPVTNYGMAIAFVHGIFDRVIAPFKV
jgi:[FeFe] hydrogenase H-cluster maturation GTPase HydF